MILIKVTNKGSLHFLMNDGRVGVSSTTLCLKYRGWYDTDLYDYKRILIPNPKKRYEFLLAFENKNC